MKKSINSVLFFGAVFLIIDQVIKCVLTNNMILNQSSVLIKNFLNITLVYNTGAAFNLLLGSRVILIIIGIAALLGILFYIKNTNMTTDGDVFVYSLLIGGILGNLIDRIFRGYVVDYLSFNIGNLYFPIFNFADACIVLSMVIILIKMLKEDLWK